MVFNWFQRQAEESPKPEPTPTPAPTSEPAPAPEPTQEPTSVSSEVAVTQPEPTPAPEVNEEEDEALAWAREAYARLKAQQQAATSVYCATLPPVQQQAASQAWQQMGPTCLRASLSGRCDHRRSFRSATGTVTHGS